MKKYLIIAAAAVMAASCGPKATTTLTGKMAPDSAAENVEIIVGSQLDTTVALVDGSFSLEVPTDVKALAYAMGDGKQIMFVSDGGSITIDFEEGEAVSKGGVNAKLQDYLDWNRDFMEDFSQKMEGLTPEEQNELLEEALEEYNDYMKKAVKANKGNVISLLAATSLELEDEKEMLEILNGLDPVFKEDPRVQNMISSLEASSGTAEGQMFKDFEVDGVKLSDYVGKGKYVLVDFWASWCGPCRREMPNLRAVYDEFHSDKFDMLSVAVWDRPEDTIQAAKEEEISWNQIINAQKVPTEIYGIQGIPHIILFGPDGTILKRNLRGDDIREAVKKALED